MPRFFFWLSVFYGLNGEQMDFLARACEVIYTLGQYQRVDIVNPLISSLGERFAG